MGNRWETARVLLRPLDGVDLRRGADGGSGPSDVRRIHGCVEFVDVPMTFPGASYGTKQIMVQAATPTPSWTPWLKLRVTLTSRLDFRTENVHVTDMQRSGDLERTADRELDISVLIRRCESLPERVDAPTP